VVNNNAAALVLALSTLVGRKGGRDVVVSRGELVEIGGSFRVPEILAAAGARLVEVGTTNRTRLDDYAAAIGEETALLLKVHPSNYRITGFVESVATAELVALARARGVPLVVDEGAGLLARPVSPRAPRAFPAGHESVAELLAAGADLVTASGDKLLGGPQAGLLVGARELVERCARSPLYRALRPGRLVALALDGVLRRRLAGEPMPLDRLWPDPPAHAARVGRLIERLGARPGGAPAAVAVRAVESEAFAGGGAAPGEGIPGLVVAIEAPRLDALSRALRTGEPAVVGYVRDGRLLLDLRTVDETDDARVVEAVAAALGAG
jgi:L-seryl-tRNA(Ser) seleniumtransferase